MSFGVSAPPPGVLDPSRAFRALRIDRCEPTAELAPWVEAYWEVVWNLPPGSSHRQTNLSHAAVTFAVEDEGAWVYGVPGPTFVRELQGTGRVFGMKFHPGAFYPWLGRSVRRLYDRRLPLEDLWGAEACRWADQAHFIRDFKAVTGVPPEAYRRRQHP